MKSMIIFAATLLLTSSSFAQETGNGAVQYHDVPIYAELYNPCCDEYVVVTGLGHVVVRNGTFNNSHFNAKGMSGVGSNNTVYTQKGALTQNVNFNEDDTEGSATWQMTFVAENGCSFRMKATIKYTINANGEVTAAFEKYTTECLDE